MNPLFHAETDRLYIRPYRVDDLERSYRLMQDKELYRFLHFDVMTYEEYKQLFNWLIASYEEGGNDFKYSFAVFLKETDQLIGWVGVGNLDLMNGEKEIYYLIGREHWGHGFAFEATQELVGYCFHTLKLNKIVAKVATENLASKKIIEKLGFTYETVLHDLPVEHAECNGELLYTLEREAWHENRRRNGC